MIIREVLTLEDAQIVRDIRNGVRRFMTKNSDFISPLQQKQFFERTMNSGDKLFLYLDENHAHIGYGYLHFTDRVWGTLGIKEEFWSQGFGTLIYKHMISCVDELWIEIFSDNRASLIAAMKSNFDIVSMNDKTVTLVAKENKK